MGLEYYVAVHEADWASPDKLNKCLAALGYAVQLAPSRSLGADKPLQTDPQGLGLKAIFEGREVELETSIVQLRENEPFAYGLKMPPEEASRASSGIEPTLTNFVPLDLNEELRRIGVISPDFKYGDYVMTMTFRSDPEQYRAGFLVMAGLIQCSDGLGFEFDTPAFGRGPFADQLVNEAREIN